jgi:hypothetical protein
MATRRFNAYKVASEEVAKFRGITDPSEGANADEAFASFQNNVESFKIRSLTNRSGQARHPVTDINGTVHQGGAFVATRGLAAGTEILAEQKVDIFQSRAKKYPWRTIKIPLGFEPPDPPSLTVRCRDITVPTNATRVLGSEDTIVGPETYLSCFNMTCADYWSAIGDIVGYDQNTGEAATVVQLDEAFEHCLTELADDGAPVPPPPTPFPPFPPVPGRPTYPGLPDPLVPEWPEFPYIPTGEPEVPPPGGTETYEPVDPQCPEATISFNPPAISELTDALVEGYQEQTYNFQLGATVTGAGDFSSLVYFTAEAEDGPNSIEVERALSNTSDFFCVKSGVYNLTITVPEGFPAGTILRGKIRGGAPDVSWSVPITIYIGHTIFDLADTGNVSADFKSKTDGEAGAFPTMNDALARFHAKNFTETTQTEQSVAVAESYTRHECVVGAGNSSLHSSKRKVNSFTRQYTLPDVAGLETNYYGIFPPRPVPRMSAAGT